MTALVGTLAALTVIAGAAAVALGWRYPEGERAGLLAGGAVAVVVGAWIATLLIVGGAS